VTNQHAIFFSSAQLTNFRKARKSIDKTHKRRNSDHHRRGSLLGLLKANNNTPNNNNSMYDAKQNIILKPVDSATSEIRYVPTNDQSNPDV